MSSLPKASDGELPRRLLGQLHGARAFTMASTFQLTRSTRLTDAPEANGGNEEDLSVFSVSSVGSLRVGSGED